MISYIKNSQIDRKKWDNCIRSSQQNMVYALSWYLDKTAPDWGGLVMDDYKAVMALPQRKKFGFSYVFQPLLTQQLGIYGRQAGDAKLTADFLKAIPADIKYVDYNLNKFHSKPESGFRTEKRINYELKLNQPYAEIEKSFSSNTKRNIQKSIVSNGVDLQVSVAEMIKLKRLEQKGSRPPAFYEWLNIYMTSIIDAGKGSIVGVRKGEELIAAAFFIICMNRIYYLVPVSTDTGKKSRAMFAIIDHIIGKYADTGLILDFEGSEIEGIARFFAGFGATKNYYYNIRRNNLPFPLKFLKR